MLTTYWCRSISVNEILRCRYIIFLTQPVRRFFELLLYCDPLLLLRALDGRWGSLVILQQILHAGQVTHRWATCFFSCTLAASSRRSMARGRSQIACFSPMLINEIEERLMVGSRGIMWHSWAEFSGGRRVYRGRWLWLRLSEVFRVSWSFFLFL